MGTVTQINADYLKKLQSNLQDLLDQVNDQIQGLGTKGATGATTSFIPPVTENLTLAAGATSFDAGGTIVKALQAMGGSVASQLAWLKNVLTDMIAEITTTISSFTGTESLNNESVAQLMNDFQKTINDVNSPAGSGSSNPNTSSSNPNTSNPNTSNPNTSNPNSSTKTPAKTSS